MRARLRLRSTGSSPPMPTRLSNTAPAATSSTASLSAKSCARPKARPTPPSSTSCSRRSWLDSAMRHWTLDDIPWDRFDRGKVDLDVMRIVKAASLVEYNGGAYAHHLCRIFHDDPDFRRAA